MHLKTNHNMDCSDYVPISYRLFKFAVLTVAFPFWKNFLPCNHSSDRVFWWNSENIATHPHPQKHICCITFGQVGWEKQASMKQAASQNMKFSRKVIKIIKVAYKIWNLHNLLSIGDCGIYIYFDWLAHIYISTYRCQDLLSISGNQQTRVDLLHLQPL